MMATRNNEQPRRFPPGAATLAVIASLLYRAFILAEALVRLQVAARPRRRLRHSALPCPPPYRDFMFFRVF